jgi:RNA-directed DNA polymerase
VLRERASEELQLPVAFLDRMANHASYMYQEYDIPKKHGFGTRRIHQPSPQLKGIQRWLCRRVLADLPLHGAATAYVPGRGIRVNAEVHAKRRFLLRVDFRDFFPSITSSDIKSFLQAASDELDDWTAADRDFFVKSVCRFGQLTIGAPTSPVLSNLVCAELDGRIQQLASERSVYYSRYADDLFFSTDCPGILAGLPTALGGILRTIPYPRNLVINHKKTRHSSKKHRRRVTGLLLTPEGDVSIGHNRKRKLRSLIYRYTQLSEAQRHHLAGWLAFAADVEPKFLERLAMKLGAANVRGAMSAQAPEIQPVVLPAGAGLPQPTVTERAQT